MTTTSAGTVAYHLPGAASIHLDSSAMSRVWMRECRVAAGALMAHTESKAAPSGSRPGALATVGVYGFSVESFLASLRGAGVGLVLDVRQRRGVRGSEYSWANAARLQAALAEAGIGYEHHKELAPTTELRELQYRADERAGVGKRTRVELAPEYVQRYTREILDRVDLAALVRRLPPVSVVALLCVERDPEACHRSLVAARMAERFGVTVRHLRP